MLALHGMVPLLEGFTSALPRNCPEIQKPCSRFRMPWGLVSFRGSIADFEKYSDSSLLVQGSLPVQQYSALLLLDTHTKVKASSTCQNYCRNCRGELLGWYEYRSPRLERAFTRVSNIAKNNYRLSQYGWPMYHRSRSRRRGSNHKVRESQWSPRALVLPSVQPMYLDVVFDLFSQA